MLKRLVISAVMVLATWSVATASHAGFSINLPGFGLHLPLPGASISIGLPFAGPPVHPAYYDERRYERRDYDRHEGYERDYGDRDYRHGQRHWDRPGYYDNGSRGFAEDGRTGFYGGQY